MKRYHRYYMDFEAKAGWLSGVCMGLPIFLLSIYYMFVNDISGFGNWELILRLWLPVILCLGYLVLLRLVRLNAPGVFAILGAVICLVLLIQLFGTGNVLRILLGIAGYIVAGGLLILCAGGWLPGRIIVSVAFFAILLLRALLFANVSGMDWLKELASLSLIAGLMFLPVCFKDPRNQE